MKTKQQGAALVIVLSLLAGSLMIGVSGMNAALIDERLAGNYRAAVLAQMVAETGAVERRTKISNHSVVDTCSELRSAIQGKNDTLLNNFEDKFFEDKDGYALGYYYEECENNSKASEIIVGQVKSKASDPADEFLSVYYYLVSFQPGSGGSGGTGGNSANFGGEPVVVGGSGVKVSGSGNVSGNIVTSGDVDISGGASVSDSIKAQGEIDYPNWWDEEKSQGFEESFDFDSVVQDPFDINSTYSDLDNKTDALTSSPYNYSSITVGSYPLRDVTIGSDGLVGYNEQNNSDEVMVDSGDFDISEIPHLSGIFPVIRTQDFTQQNGSLTVTGDSLLIVDGDLKLGYGGDEGLLFEGDNTLTILVNGDVDLKSSLSMEDVSIENSKGVPRFTIYALGEDVKISGSSQVMARIYAPFANSKITGSGGLRGTMWAEELEVSGDGGFMGEGAFDVDSGESEGGEGGSIAWEPFVE